MATRKHSTNPSSSEPVYRIAHLFRDPVLKSVFAAAERDNGAAFAVADPRPPVLTGGASVRIVEFA